MFIYLFIYYGFTCGISSPIEHSAALTISFVHFRKVYVCFLHHIKISISV